MLLDVYSGITDTVKGQIQVYDTFIFNHTLMQEHRISVGNYALPAPLDVQIRDYIIFKSNKYKINTLPTVLVTAFYTYNFALEGPEYDLFRKIVMHEGSADFPYYGDAEAHMQLMIDNINTLDPGWSLGVIEATPEMFISYVNLTVRTGLNTIADAFKMEFSVENKEISLKLQAGSNTTYEFEVGQHLGMYNLTRTALNDKKIVTKVYGFGSTRNLPSGYRGGQTRLVFEDRFLLNNEAIYSIIEGQYTDEEIYPTREGDVTAVGPGFTDDSKTFVITDSTLDFDLNTYILQSVEPKVSFTTGDLLGEEFVIKSYDNATKKITLIVKVNSSNIKLPSVAPEFLPVPGDKYKLIDIGLPATYVTAAEVRLQETTEAFLLENSIPRVEYDLEMDPLYAKQNGIELKPGDRIKVIHPALGINHMIRVNSVEYPITFPEELTNNTKFNVAIGNFVNYDKVERLQAAVIENRKNIVTVDRRNIELARRNTANLRDLQDLIFDPDDFFDTGNIRPLSINTALLSVGAKSQNFHLNDVVIKTNYLGDENVLAITSGLLEHFTVQIPGVGYTWVIPAKMFSALDPTKPYYMYAKCSSAALTGEWMLSLTPVGTEDTPGFWNFNIGILYKVVGGYRDYDFTFGNTTVVGDNITTGRIKDITGQNYFDLKTGKFNMGTPSSGVDWDVTAAGKFMLRGALVQSGSGVTNLLPVFRGVYAAATTYYPADTVTFGGSLWRFINVTPTAGQSPVEGVYWTMEAAAGSGNVTLITPNDKMAIVGNKITKVSGGAAWTDAQVYSQEGFIGGCVLSWKVVGALAGKTYMMGIDQVPTVDFNYTSIDYCYYVTGAVLGIRENGTTATPASTVVAIGDILSIKYDGLNVTYYKNGVVMRTLQTTSDRLFYMDSSFNTVGSTAEGISFSAAGTAGKNAAGSVVLTPTLAANILIDGGTVTKIAGGAAAFDAGVYSQQGYRSGAILSVRAINTVGAIVVGLNDVPTSSTSTADIKFGIYLGPSGALLYSETGVTASLGTYVVGDIFQVKYEGNTVTYYKNGVVLRSVQTTYDRLFYLDSSFFNIPATVGDLTFSPVAAPGTGTTNFICTDGNMQVQGNRFTKIAGGSAAYNGGVYSMEYFVGGAIASAKFVTADVLAMIGLNADPATSSGATDIDFGIIGTNTGSIGIFESGTTKTIPATTYAAGDILSVRYEGTTISYFKNATLIATTTTTAGRTFYFDSSFFTQGKTIENVSFSSIGLQGNYTEYRFAKNGSTTVPPALTNTDLAPALWSTTQPAVGAAEYLWVIKAEKNGFGTALLSNWSTPIRMNGEKGDTGTTGAQGPYITNSGNYDNDRSYLGSATRIEAVFYSGNWYVTRTDAGSIVGVLPTNAAKWNPFGATFDSVATGLLLASAATIDNLTVRNVVTSDTGQKVGISGADNNFFFHDGTGTEVLLLDDDIIPLEGGGFGPGIRLGQLGDNFLYMGEEGLFIHNTTTGKSAYMRTTGIKTSGNLDIGTNIDIGGQIGSVDGGTVPFTGYVGIKRQDDETGGIERVYNMFVVGGLITKFEFVV